MFLQAEDGIRVLVRSRGLGDVYKRQDRSRGRAQQPHDGVDQLELAVAFDAGHAHQLAGACLLSTSDAADQRSSVDLGGRRIIKQKSEQTTRRRHVSTHTSTLTTHPVTAL